MTNLSSHIAVGSASATTARTKRNVARHVLEIALVIVFAAALTGAWLAFFTFVPFDLRVR